jgi:hypothetical protein
VVIVYEISAKDIFRAWAHYLRTSDEGASASFARIQKVKTQIILSDIQRFVRPVRCSSILRSSIIRTQ